MVGRKALIALMILAVMVIAIPVMAADQSSGVQFANINLNGDTLYLPNSGSFAIGVGSTIATLMDGVIELRIEGAYTLKADQPNMLGAGVGVQVKKFVEMMGGTWISEKFRSSIGIVGLFNLNGAVSGRIFDPAIYVTIIGLQF